jgi:hypothetical protein
MNHGNDRTLDIVEEMIRSVWDRTGQDVSDTLSVMDLFCGHLIIVLSEAKQLHAVAFAEIHRQHVDDIINKFFDNQEKKRGGRHASET